MVYIQDKFAKIELGFRSPYNMSLWHKIISHELGYI